MRNRRRERGRPRRAPARATVTAPASASASPRELRALLAEARAQLAEHAATVEELTTHREELKAQNEMLTRAERDLWIARDTLTDLFELAPIPYITLTGATLISAVNVKAARFLGDVSRGSIIGRPFATLLSREDRPRFRQHVAAARRSGEINSIELDLLLPSGLTPVQMDSTVAKTGWLYSAIIDLRERQRAEGERRALAVKAEAARSAGLAKDEFLATVSHELRTPLTPVVAAVAALRQACQQAKLSTGNLFEIIERNLHQEVRLIDDLLDVTGLAHGKLTIEKDIADLHEIICQAVNQTRPAADEKGVRLSSALSAKRYQVCGDADRLRQVFANLLRNGIKFTPKGGQVVISSRNVRDKIAVEVRDSGVGIAPEEQARIFDRFVQGSAARSREGLGLGLSIAREFVAAHGGRIEARSLGAGRGATFEVLLGTAAVADAGKRAPATRERDKPAPAAAAPAGGGKRILFVEDHPDTARLMAIMLARAGHRVKLAQSVAAALTHADEPFDVLVSDIGLPDGTGVDLMRQLRAKRPIRGIALSGYGGSEDIDRSRAAGFDRHLIKPVDLPKLLQAIDELDAAPP
ncbi:MAG TPA: ATP-binding protein [Polyangia bacterium]|nr:ATP-binding protein [Polyangia bacterium]